MLDVAVLAQALKGPGRDVDATVLQGIQAEAEKGSVEATSAAKRAEAELRRGVTDIQVIAYFLFGVFLEQGMAYLATVHLLVKGAITESWHVLRPDTSDGATKAKRVDGALKWLYRSILNDVQFHEHQRDEVFASWPKTVGRAVLDASQDLREALIERLGEGNGAKGVLSELDGVVRDHFNRTPPAATAPEPADSAPAASEEHEEPVAETHVETTAQPHEHSAPAVNSDFSEAFHLFLRRLEAFQALAERGELMKAAIVAEDVRRQMEEFDPKVHFPKLLAPYFRSLSTHIDRLAPYMDSSGSPAWKALQQFYTVDFDAFVGS